MEWMCPDTEKSVKNTREFTDRKLRAGKTAEVMQQSLSGRDTARALHYFSGVLRQEFCAERTKIAGCTVRGDRGCGRGNFLHGRD